jgi:hypothetical protein
MLVAVLQYMPTTTLKFPSILSLVDFKISVGTKSSHPNVTDLTLTGYFQEADIELAKAGFQAIVMINRGR